MKKVFSIIGICMGILTVIFGSIMLAADIYDNHCSTAGSYAFGADFYTEEYRATAKAANNLYNVSRGIENIYRSSGFLVILFGGVVISYFGCIYADTKKTIPAVAQAVNNPGNRVDDLPDL